MSLDRGVCPPDPPQTADEVRRYQWRVDHLQRWLEDASNIDHPFVMGAHIERSGFIEALRSVGYPVEE